jgi:GNAT superfamily N-acetyltransferase
VTALPLAFRPVTDADVGLVYSSWLRSYWDARPPQVWDIPRETYFSDAGHHGVVTRLLARSVVTVAHAPDDPDEVYGWICVGARGLHYVYVKELWRRKGVATRLLDGAPVGVASHMTKAFRDGPGKRLALLFNPYATRGD